MRFDTDIIREVTDALVRKKRRSILTGFGIFWGVFMLLALIGGGAGLNKLLMQNFEGFATNSAFIWADATSKPYNGMKEGRYWYLDDKDVLRLRRMVPELDIITGMIGRWGQVAEYGIKSVSCVIKGISPEYGSIEQPLLKYGRFLNEEDCIQKRKVCVIGKRIYTSLFSEGEDPCGKLIKIGPVYYTVVGVNYASGNISIQGSADEAALVPMQVVRQIYGTGPFYEIVGITAKEGVKLSSVEPRIRSVIARQHNFDVTDKPAMMFLNTEQMFSLLDNLFEGLGFLVWLVGVGTILAGVIGVSNIMMVTVRERTVEIGIRRAIGATPGEILGQIIAESILLTAIAGFLGIALAVAVLSGAASSTGIAEFQIGFTDAVLTALMLSVLGVAAGLPPALRAMKIKPVDAMRDE